MELFNLNKNSFKILGSNETLLGHMAIFTM